MKLFAKKPIPHVFVLEELERLGVHTKAMFGCTAIYHDNKILLVLRERTSGVEDNGIWVATYQEFHNSLKKELPSLRSIRVFGPGETDWQVIPSESLEFESEAFKVCELILKGDHRIGRVPKSKLPRTKKKSAKAKGRAKKLAKKSGERIERKISRKTSKTKAKTTSKRSKMRKSK